MTKRAEMETRITGTDAGIRGLDGLKTKLGEVADAGQRTSVRLKEFRALWDDPVGASRKQGWSDATRVLTSVGKAAAEVVGSQIRSVADAVTAPAKTSYAGAIAVANTYRDTTQRIVSSTGQSYGEVNRQVLGASTRLGLLPEQVQSYGRGVRSLTGDWKGAMSGLDAYQARALQTDRTLEQMVPTAAHLAATFGISSTQDVMKFFGTIDSQAKLANVSATVLESTFLNVTSAFSGLKKERGGGLMALTGAVMGGAPSVELGQERMAGIGSFLMGHRRLLERVAHQRGTLKKGEHFYDAQGQSTAAHTFGMIETLQGEAQRKYMTKDRLELLGRMEESGTMPAHIGAGLMNLDIPAIRKRAEKETGLKGQAALDKWGQSDAGKRSLADARKVQKDIGLGDSMLGAQDTAVGMGGGAAGIALAASGQIFEKATGVFADAVNIFAGRSAPAIAGATGAAATGTGVGAVGTTVAKAVLPRIAAPVALATIATMSGDTQLPAGVEAQDRIDNLQRRIATREAAGKTGRSRGTPGDFTGWNTTDDLKAQLAQAQAQKLEIDYAKMAQENAKAQAGQIQKVQVVGAPTVPAGQEQPQ